NNKGNVHVRAVSFMRIKEKNKIVWLKNHQDKSVIKLTPQVPILPNKIATFNYNLSTLDLKENIEYDVELKIKYLYLLKEFDEENKKCVVRL
ncbi:hypothetical protein MHK_008427, partial [Candidatus Magnetomorum sp. HK-1]